MKTLIVSVMSQHTKINHNVPFSIQVDGKLARLKAYRWYRFLSIRTSDNKPVEIAEMEIEFADHKCDVRVHLSPSMCRLSQWARVRILVIICVIRDSFFVSICVIR